jgi:aryl carrier-like protein
VGIDENFFDLGGDSITSLRIVAKAKAVGLKVSVRQIFTHPTVAELALVSEQLIKSPPLSSSASSSLGGNGKSLVSGGNYEEEEEEDDVVLRPDDAAAGDPFPLIGIQKAYWIGIQLARAQAAVAEEEAPSPEGGKVADSGGGGHGDAIQPIIFNEFDAGEFLDVERLQCAWRKLIRRHDMLRSVLTDTGDLTVLHTAVADSGAADDRAAAAADRDLTAPSSLLPSANDDATIETTTPTSTAAFPAPPAATQLIIEDTFRVAVVDLTEEQSTQQAADETFAATCKSVALRQRDRALSRPLSVDTWPLFECTAVKLYVNETSTTTSDMDQQQHSNDDDNDSSSLRSHVGDGSGSTGNQATSSNASPVWRVQVKLSLVLLDALSEITLRRELEMLYEDPVSWCDKGSLLY